MRADDGKFKMTYADAAKSKEKRQADKAAREKQWQCEDGAKADYRRI